MEIIIWLTFEIIFFTVHFFLSLIPISNPIGRVAVTLYSQVFVNVLAIYIFRRHLCKTDAIPLFKRKNLKCVLWTAIIGVGVCLGHRILFLVFWNFTVQSLEKISQVVANQSQALFMNSILGILYTSFLAPITEEIFFHGIIFNTARKKHSNLYAIIISSLLFAIGHMNGIQFISGMFMGIVIGCAIILTDNVYIGIIIHVANNAFSLINANLLNSIWGQEYWQVYVQMFVGIIMLVIGFFMLWRENINKYPNGKVSA